MDKLIFSVSFLASREVFVLFVLGANMMEMMIMIHDVLFMLKIPAGFDIEKLPFRLYIKVV